MKKTKFVDFKKELKRMEYYVKHRTIKQAIRDCDRAIKSVEICDKCNRRTK